MLLPGILIAQSKELDYKIQTLPDSVRVILPATFSVSLVKLPAFNEELWGKDVKCTLAILKTDNHEHVSGVGANDSEIVFAKPNGLLKSFELIPIAFSKSDAKPPHPDNLQSKIIIIGISEELQEIEDELYRLSIETFNFNKTNQCFSCHTSYPLLKACNEASNSGIKVPTEKIVAIGKQIQAFQNTDGTFFFPKSPAYGKITTSLCAGATLALATRYSTSFLQPLKRLFNFMPLWQTKTGQLDSDFFFPPFFLGKMTSGLFESIIVSALCYAPDASPENDSTAMYDRLKWLKKTAKQYETKGDLSKLILLHGAPYFYQFPAEEREAISQKIRLMEQNEAIRNSAFLSAIFLSAAKGFVPETNAGKSLNSFILEYSNRLSDRIWLCFIRILNTI
jgi:hypothetical protein